MKTIYIVLRYDSYEPLDESVYAVFEWERDAKACIEYGETNDPDYCYRYVSHPIQLHWHPSLAKTLPQPTETDSETPPASS